MASYKVQSIRGNLVELKLNISNWVIRRGYNWVSSLRLDIINGLDDWLVIQALTRSVDEIKLNNSLRVCSRCWAGNVNKVEGRKILICKHDTDIIKWNTSIDKRARGWPCPGSTLLFLFKSGFKSAPEGRGLGEVYFDLIRVIEQICGIVRYLLHVS